MVKKHETVSDKIKSKVPRTRSPNYPSMGLAESIDRIKVLCSYNESHWTPVGIAQEKWKYTSHGSAGNQCVAALKAFGLLEVQGKGDKREVRPSARARRIVHDSPERDRLIREAALSPAIHSHLWAKYGKEGLPPPEVVRRYLLLDRNFNKVAVDEFVAQFRETATFAKLTASDIIDSTKADALDDEDQPEEVTNNGRVAMMQTDMPQISKDMSNKLVEAKFPLEEGIVTLVWPSNIGKDSFQDLSDWIAVALKRIARSAGAEYTPGRSDG